MTINANIRDRAYQFFIEEAPELLHTLESNLLTLSQARNASTVHSLMRAAHSIKGGAASVGLTDIASLAHRLENIFKALYSETLEIDQRLEDDLLRAFDCLRLPLMEQITTGSFQPSALTTADRLFDQLETRLGDALLRTETYVPSAADLGVDMITSIFEVDVAQGLDRLTTVLENPQEQEIAGELRAQAEVFAGFAELLNLPTFGAIATATQQALNTNPDQVLEIAYLALTEFEQSRQAILSGELAGGAGPSTELLALTQPLAHRQAVTQPPVMAEPQSQEQHLEPVSEPLSEPLRELVEEPLDWKRAIVESDTVIDAELFASELPHRVSQSETSSLVPAEARFNELVSLAAETPEPTTLDISSSVQFESDRFQQTPKRPGFSVRVDADRLERMNNLVGELVTNRDGVALQNTQLQESVRELLSRLGRFQGVMNRLRELSDQLLIAPEVPARSRGETGRTGTETEARSTPQSQSSEEQPESAATNSTINRAINHVIDSVIHNSPNVAANVEFDALEMDRYSTIHSHMQEIFEEMVQLEEVAGDITLFAQQSNQSLDQQRHTLNRLRDELVWARMLPLSEVLNRFPRMVRDMSSMYGKPVQLTLSGENILIERAMLEKLYDPLLHLLRNAFDHGIEPAHLRQQQGKPAEGTIEIQSYYKGNQTLIEIRDDGQGLNLTRIQRRALELGWLSPEQLPTLPPEKLLNLIFEPGFSTAAQVSELSGRGVGLDVVQEQIHSIKGRVAVTSTPGKGTTFTLSLPFTLTITKLVTCLVGPVTVALPADNIEEILTPQKNQIRETAGQRLIYWREEILPVYRVADLLDYNCPLPDANNHKPASLELPKDWAAPMLILRQGQQFAVLEVDRLLAEQELLIKPFGSAIAPPDYIYACTVLAEGSLVPVIDGAALLARVKPTNSSALTYQVAAPSTLTPLPALPPKGLTSVRTVQLPTILVVDDSTTLRRTMALFLEREGFRVLQARNGQEAIDQLQAGTAVRLIVCDIEMPNMNGFEFLSYRRQDPNLLDIPVVMLTSRSNDKHRWLAMQLGATAYFTKPYLEQEFLSALKDLI
jgi:chemotaxis family two-component system sensor histidine kinase/response regulator PixL